MNPYPWLADNINEWQKLVLADKIPHALLILGSKGIGKIELANSMAAIALCESLADKGACQHCPSCQLLAANNHLDLIQIRAENSIIKVDQIRKLSLDINLTTTRNQHKVVVIENAENLNVSSANALLKTLEEPPESTIIILTCSDTSRLLPTIKSRCLKTNVANPSHQNSKVWLQKNHSQTKNEDIDLSLVLSNSAPLLADQLLKNQQIEKVQSMFEDLYQLRIRKLTVLQISNKWQDHEYLENLVFVANYLMIVLQGKLNLNLNNLFFKSSLSKWIQTTTVNAEKLINYINSLHILIKRLNTPLKKELLIEELLINWQNV